MDEVPPQGERHNERVKEWGFYGARGTVDCRDYEKIDVTNDSSILMIVLQVELRARHLRTKKQSRRSTTKKMMRTVKSMPKLYLLILRRLSTDWGSSRQGSDALAEGRLEQFMAERLFP